MLDKQGNEKSQHNALVKRINVTPRCLKEMSEMEQEKTSTYDNTAFSTHSVSLQILKQIGHSKAFFIF